VTTSESGLLPCACGTCDEQRRSALPFPLSLMGTLIVCSTCGNKRCPKATHHDRTCSGSNALGQEGQA